MDLVVQRQGRIDAIEVKAGDSRGHLDRSARSFIDAYAPPRFIVVSSAPYPDTRVGKTRVQFIQPHQVADLMREE